MTVPANPYEGLGTDAYITGFGHCVSPRRPMWGPLVEAIGRLGRPVTVWSAGCHVGSETYYLAMCLLDAGLGDRVTIRTCDANVQRMNIARAGLYLADAVEHDVRMGRFPAGMRRRYLRDAGHLPHVTRPHQVPMLEITEDVRALVEFTEPVWVPDHVESADVIYLRNIWRHITGAEKRALVRKLRDALPPDGIVAFRYAPFEEVALCMPEMGHPAIYGRPDRTLGRRGVAEKAGDEIWRGRADAPTGGVL